MKWFGFGVAVICLFIFIFVRQSGQQKVRDAQRWVDEQISSRGEDVEALLEKNREGLGEREKHLQRELAKTGDFEAKKKTLAQQKAELESSLATLEKETERLAEDKEAIAAKQAEDNEKMTAVQAEVASYERKNEVFRQLNKMVTIKK